MPLSDREQHLLEQMEQALYAEDPKFASQMQGSGARARKRQYLIGVLGFAIGLAVVLLGVTMSNMWVGALGFAVMVAGVVYAVTPRKHAAIGAVQADGTVRPHQHAGRGRSASSGTFMQRLEQRWERRRRDY